MAVYQGARPRRMWLAGGLALPRSRPFAPPTTVDDAPEVEQVPTPAPSRAARRAASRRRVGGALAAIVVLFGLGFVSLTQSVRVAATSYDIVRLDAERDRLDALRLDIASDLSRLGSEPAVRKLAFDHGLGQLDGPMIVPAR
jgi:hypothetical protein